MYRTILKEKLPNATLGVDSLEIHSQNTVRDPDPFLYVRDGNEIYYIEQWDERDLPRYEE